MHRIECLRVIRTATPLYIGESIQSEMSEGGQFQSLPLELSPARHHVRGFPDYVLGTVIRGYGNVTVGFLLPRRAGEAQAGA